jgi:hypothetical protein
LRNLISGRPAPAAFTIVAAERAAASILMLLTCVAPRAIRIVKTPLLDPPNTVAHVRRSEKLRRMSAAATPSSSPSPFYKQHHAVEAPVVDATEFRTAWRRRSPVDGLLAGGLISAREYRVAIGFRRTYEAAHRGSLTGSTWGTTFVDPHCRQPRPERSERELDAVGWIRTVEHALGGLYPLVEWCVVAELSWCEIGRRVGIDPRTGRRWCAVAIAALAATTD